MRKTKWGDYEMKVPIPTFNYETIIVFSHSLKESAKVRLGYVPKSLTDPCAKAAHVVRVEDGDGGETSYLFFNYDATPAYISHEAWHAIRYMLQDWAGAGLDNETVAYHLGYLVGIIHEFKSKVEVLYEHRSDSQRQKGGLRGMQSTTETGAQGTSPQTSRDN